MKPSYLSIVAILALLADGCANIPSVGPDYHKPTTKAPTQWTEPLAGGETNGPANLAAWWKNFGDTNLNALIATAIQSNLTLQIAESRVREARAEKGIVSGGLWPSVGAGGSYSRNLYGANTFPPLSYWPYWPAAQPVTVFAALKHESEAASPMKLPSSRLLVVWANAKITGHDLDVQLGFVGNLPRDRDFRTEVDAEIARLEAFLDLKNQRNARLRESGLGASDGAPS